MSIMSIGRSHPVYPIHGGRNAKNWKCSPTTYYQNSGSSRDVFYKKLCCYARHSVIVADDKIINALLKEFGSEFLSDSTIKKVIRAYRILLTNEPTNKIKLKNDRIRTRISGYLKMQKVDLRVIKRIVSTEKDLKGDLFATDTTKQLQKVKTSNPKQKANVSKPKTKKIKEESATNDKRLREAHKKQFFVKLHQIMLEQVDRPLNVKKFDSIRLADYKITHDNLRQIQALYKLKQKQNKSLKELNDTYQIGLSKNRIKLLSAIYTDRR